MQTTPMIDHLTLKIAFDSTAINQGLGSLNASMCSQADWELDDQENSTIANTSLTTHTLGFLSRKAGKSRKCIRKKAQDL